MATKIFNLLQGGYLQFQTSTPTLSNSKPTLVFLHYWGGSIRTWRKVISGLRETYPTIAISLPGWGESTLPSQDSNTSKLTIASQAQSVTELLLARTTEPICNGLVLVGHSMGAKICMAIASAISKDRNLSIRGMVLIAPAPPSPLVLPTEMQEQQRHAYDSAESVEWTVINILSDRSKLSDEDINFAIEDSLAGSKIAKEAWPSYNMSEEVVVPEGDGMRVVVLAGEEDVVETKGRVESEVVERLKGKGYDVDFEVLEGGRHLIPLESPDKIMDLITSSF